MLQATTLKTPVGTLYLIAAEQVLLGASFNSFNYLIQRFDDIDQQQEIKEVKKIAKISDLIR